MPHSERRSATLRVPVDHGRRWWSISAKPLEDVEGRFCGWRGVGSDITDIRLSGSDAVRAARLDPLTGVANRLLLREQLEEALLRQVGGDCACALLLVDLDRFKLVNDTLGHSVGDQLLCEVARRLEKCAGERRRRRAPRRRRVRHRLARRRWRRGPRRPRRQGHRRIDPRPSPSVPPTSTSAPPSAFRALRRTVIAKRH